MIRWFTLLFFAAFSLGKAQNFSEKFQSYLQVRDTLRMDTLLHQWRKESPEDPERFVCAFNYQMHMAFVHWEKRKDSLVMYKALPTLDSGLQRFPRRLDMYLGKAYVYQQMHLTEPFLQTCQSLLEQGKASKQGWQWNHGQPVSHAEDIITQAFHEYMDQTDERTLQLKIGELLLKYYPNHPPTTIRVAELHFQVKNWDTGIKLLEKARKAHPGHPEIALRLGIAYAETGKLKEAEKMFNMAIEYGFGPTADEAAERLKSLRP
jgi:pentatricopeptide repeat protein